MSFATFMDRKFLKRPIWLYKVTIGGISYHYTSKVRGYETPANSPDIDFPTGQIWTAAAIVRGEIFQTVKANRQDTYVRLPTRNPLSTTAIANRDDTTATLKIWQGFEGDPDNEFKVMFSGRITEIEPAVLLTTLICEQVISEPNKSSVAQVVQRSCRHAHYFTNADGGGCRLNIADFQTTEQVTAATGRTVTVPSAANQVDGFYLAGVFTYDGIDYMIESQIGDTLILENIPVGLSAELEGGPVNVVMARGCNLTPQSCDSFNNIENYGGFNDMLDTPFDGRSMH